MDTLSPLNATYLVNTTNGATIPAGYAQVSADIRDTEKTKVAPEQRYRNILIKQLVIPGVEEKFQPLLLDKLYSLAAEQFKENMEKTARMGKTVDQSAYTVSGLLLYYSTDAKSGKMTKESILEWFDGSTTKEFITSRNPAAVPSYRDNYAKLASPNHGLNPRTCTSLLAVLQDADTTHPVCSAIATKMQATITKYEQSVVPELN